VQDALYEALVQQGCDLVLAFPTLSSMKKPNLLQMSLICLVLALLLTSPIGMILQLPPLWSATASKPT
jgi:hypothetical protein